MSVAARIDFSIIINARSAASSSENVPSSECPLTSDEGVTASMWRWRKRGHGGGRGVALSISIVEKWKVVVGSERICFVRVRISSFVIRLI